MSFLRNANTVNTTYTHTQEAREAKRGSYGNSIRGVWLRENESFSMRFVAQDPEVKDGIILKLGNPAQIQKTTKWNPTSNRPDASWLNPATFGAENPLDDLRRQWWRDEKARLPRGEKIDSRRCPVPGTQDRFLLWGLVTDVALQRDDLEPEKLLGFRYFEMGGDSWKSLVNCINNASVKCEHCSRKLTIAGVDCPGCNTTLIDEKDAKQLPSDTLAAASEVGLQDVGIDACPSCGASLQQALTVRKDCSEHGSVEGLSPMLANIRVTRTGKSSYAFEIDMDTVGAIEEFPGELLSQIQDVQLVYGPETGSTSSNLYGLSGTTPDQLRGVVRTDVQAPRSPLGR